MNRGLPRLAGGLAKREREAWEEPCALSSCSNPAAGLIDNWTGPKPICEVHIPQAERMGYKVRRRDTVREALEETRTARDRNKAAVDAAMRKRGAS